MNTRTVKPRFCPSPTGHIHLGNTRTALFNALFARKMSGVFLLRIEDTDRDRSREEYTEGLQDDLSWLGFQWQEGPGVGGSQGPYWQSQRQFIYDNYYELLAAEHLAYPCFCSEEQLALARKLQRTQGLPPRYPGTCRHLSVENVEKKLAQGLKPTLRFKVPTGTQIEFVDYVKGQQRFNADDIGDFIIRRADGTASFLYCNAIDDALMQVTHVIRGEDHLTNTPRQMMILQALNLPVPEYAHISMIVGVDGSPLSKRHGSRSVKQLRENGYLPAAINNYLARLGHFYANNEFMSFEQLAQEFDLTNLASSPARFDKEQLLFWQKTALNLISAEEFCAWSGEKVWQIVPQPDQALFIDAIRNNVTFPEDVENWAHRFYNATIHYNDEQHGVLKVAGAEFFNQALIALDKEGLHFNGIALHLKTVLGTKGKELYQPLRVALTADMHGPEMTKVIELLGLERVKQRFAEAQKLLAE